MSAYNLGNAGLASKVLRTMDLMRSAVAGGRGNGATAGGGEVADASGSGGGDGVGHVADAVEAGQSAARYDAELGRFYPRLARRKRRALAQSGGGSQNPFSLERNGAALKPDAPAERCRQNCWTRTPVVRDRMTEHRRSLRFEIIHC